MSEAHTARQRRLRRAMALCARAQWHSLELLSSPLAESAGGEDLDTGLTRLFCDRGAGQLPNRDPPAIGSSLPPHLALPVEMGFLHLRLAQQWLLLQDIARAAGHARSMLHCFLAAGNAAGKRWQLDEEQGFLEGGSSLIEHLQAHVGLRTAVSSGAVPDRITFVLGMHRSGTSALTGMLCQAGCAHPPDPMNVTEANPKGYWESTHISRLNDNLLAELGSGWSNVEPLPPGWEERTATIQWRQSLLDHIERSYTAADHPVIKDPRFCLLLSGLGPWLESGAVHFCFLLQVRHPLEVARSLHGRPFDRLDAAVAIRLWLRHMFDAERCSRGHPRLVVPFDRLLSHPAEVLTRSTALLQGLEPESIADAEAFVEPGLRHHRGEGLEPEMEASMASVVTECQLAMQVFQTFLNDGDDDRNLALQMDRLHQQWLLLN